MKYQQPRFSVSGPGTEEYRRKYDHTFGKCDEDCPYCQADAEIEKAAQALHDGFAEG